MKREHVPALDGLRGIAILLVLGHTFDIIHTRGGTGHHIDLALDFGWIGVMLFFVLSGFLITGILLDTAPATRAGAPRYLRTFWLRRVLRIFPLYYGVLFVAFVIVPRIAATPPGYGAHQLWLWTYTGNFAEPFGRGEAVFPHFWSLAVEEQFYLVWPFVVWLAGRRGVLALSTLLVAVAIACRVIVRAHWGDEAAYTFTPCRMDALAMGAAAAALMRGDATRRAIERVRPGVLAAIGGAIVVAGGLWGHVARTNIDMQHAGYSVISLGFAALILAVLRPGLFARTLSFAPLRRIGVYSYGMYVFHAPLHLLVGLPLLARLAPTYGAAVGLAYLVVAGAVTFAAAALSYHLYERRFLALKPVLAP